MNDIILDLYFGKVTPSHDFAEQTPLFLQNRKKFLELGKQIRERLDEDSLAMFQEYCTYSENLISISNEESFRKGFVLGGQIFTEVLTKKETKK